jgi:hypothetical protein
LTRSSTERGDPDLGILLTDATIITMGPQGVLRGGLLLSGSAIEAIDHGLAEQVGADSIVIDAGDGATRRDWPDASRTHLQPLLGLQ